MLDIIKTNFKDRETQNLINKLYEKYNNGFYIAFHFASTPKKKHRWSSVALENTTPR